MKRIFTFLSIIFFVGTLYVNNILAQGTWTKKADFPMLEDFFSASFSIGTKGYIAIEQDSHGELVSKNLWEWNQMTNVWTKKADYPGKATTGVASFSIGTKGYIATGVDNSTGVSTNELWEYDPSIDSWTQKASLPDTLGRVNAVAFSIGSKGYVVLGSDNNYEGAYYFKNFWEWDQATNVWTQKADFSGLGRSWAVGFSIDNKGYIGTGYAGSNMLFKDFWEWDQATNVWTQKADLEGERRMSAAGFSMGNKGYIGYGMEPYYLASYHDFVEWDQATNDWTKKADLEGAVKRGKFCFSIGNKVYFKRNNASEKDSAFWVYDFFNPQDSHTDIVPQGAVAKKLSTDQFSFTEGPVWYRDSVLLFTSYSRGGHIYSYDSLQNKFSIFCNIEANGLTLDREGNLLSTNAHSIVMLNKKGIITKTLADTYNGKAFTSPNDLIADSKGGAYFSDLFIFGSPIQDKDAVYYVDSTGVVKRVIEDMGSNGVILSPDGKKLYASGGEEVYSYDVAPDGSLSDQSVFAKLQIIDGVVTGSDGMAIDIHGNLYVSVYTGVQIFSPDGKFITDIKIPKGSLNCDFGGKDFKTLYITEFNSLYSIDLNYPGFAVSRKYSQPIGANSISNQPRFTFYPNPVQNVLHLDISGKTGILEIFDMTGKSLLLKKLRDTNPSIDVSVLENGIYIVKVFSDNQLFTGKFVKQ